MAELFTHQRNAPSPMLALLVIALAVALALLAYSHKAPRRFEGARRTAPAFAYA
jgi:hypothetical protein